MSAVPVLEAEHLARGAERRALAAAELEKPQHMANPFIVLVTVLATAGTVAFLAVSTSLDTRGFVGAFAGGASVLAVLGYGELRRLQRRVEALETLARGGGV